MFIKNWNYSKLDPTPQEALFIQKIISSLNIYVDYTILLY